MAALSNAEPRRSYSWWWDSHIIPKHSKWLQGNLADMDGKVKALIKLIDEDADSFAKRAEMYYKKRPELIKLVEEFYRAYRALAERYDHATGALHQAQRTMAEAFPNQFPLEFFDECISLDVGTISHESARGSFQSNGIHLDPLGLPLQRDAVKLKEAPKEACLNQLNQMNASGEEVAGANFAEGGEGKFMEYKLLQKEISRLSKENQDLKKQVTLESARADRNESEVQRMKETCLKVKCEKEDSLSRYLESMTRVSDLEDEISRTKADIEKLNDEMMKGTLCLNNAQQRSLVLQKANQSLEFELNVLKKKIEQQQEELNKKEQEVSVLNSSLQSELQRSEKAEIACKSVEKLQSESLEEIMHLEIELKSEVEKLKDVQKELEKMREENLKLSEQELSSALKIMSLQDEIISLMDLIRKLEDETDLHIEEKESLEIQLYRIRKERDDLEEKYHTLMEEVQAVNLSVESLHALIEDLRNANLELKDTIKKNEDERNLYLHNLSNMQTMSNKIPALEVSLWDANQEITRLRMKIKELEDSSAHLCCRISIHLAEKAALLSQMHAATQNMENLSKRNAFLDNSLFDMNVEVEDLRGKLKNVEESCKSLQDEKYNLLSEKSVLMSQVEGFKHSLQMLEGRYSELEGKSSNLEKDKDVTLYQMAELQELLRLKKEEHSILFQSGKSQLSAMANQMCLLQEQGRQREEDFEMQQQQIINAQIEIFILQRCLCDMKGENFILTCKYEEHYDALKSAGKLIQGLEQKYETQETKMKSLIENNKKLRGRIHVIIRSLKMDLENVSLDDTKDELLLQLIFSEVKQMLLAISEAQDEKQRLLLDKSVVVTLLKQYGKYVTDLRAEKDILERESEVNAQKFTQLKSNNDELVEMTELLRKDMQASKQQEEALRSEVDLLFRQLTYLQGFCSSLQIDYSKVLEENNVISRKLNSLREDKAKLGEDNIDLLKDFIALDCLSVVFRSLNSERELTLQHISKERIDFYKMKNKLEQEIALINGKILILEVENTHLKESFANLNVCRRNLFGIQHDVSHSQSINELNRQAYTWENALARDDLSQTNHILKDMKPDTCRNVNDIKLDVYNAKLTRAGREKISALLDDCGSMENKIECLPLENCRRFELHEFAEEMEELLYVVQFERINAVMYKDKVLELMKVCENIETGAKAQTEILRKEITSKNSAVTELDRKIYVLEGENRQLKADLNEYSLFWGSLWDDVAILEELILSLARRHSTSTRQELEDDQEPCSNTVTMQEELDNYNATEPTEKLQNLHDKVKLLQEVLMDTGSVLELERLESSASLETAWREIEGLKLKKVRDNEIKITKSKYDQIIKDIQLDIVLNSSRYRNSILSRGLRKAKDSDEVTEQMLELLGRYEEGCSNQKQKGPLMIENDLADHQIEEMEAKYTSDELVAEKELGVDKLELPPKVDSCQEWNRKVIERLFSDAQRLLLLQSSLRDLQKNMETSEKVNQPTRSEFNAVKVQLKEAQTTISQLIEVNSNLTKKVEDFSDDLVERKESGGKRHKQISDRARKVSEKIGRLELEMQKIQYNLMKFEEEHPSKRTRIVKRRPVIRLREYIYGRRNSKRQKEGSSCGCMRPAEISD